MAEIKFERPVSPHLQIYRLSPTMVMSIVHRITGAALYFGILLLALWLLAVSGSADQFAFANNFFGSWFGLLILVGYSWTLLHHMLGGVRHLIWDTGLGFEPKERQFLAIGTLVGSVTLTILVWAIAWWLRG